MTDPRKKERVHYRIGPNQSACNERVLRGSLTASTANVTCKACRAAMEYKAAATERRLISEKCPRCADTPQSFTHAHKNCYVCAGTGRVVPCHRCKNKPLVLTVRGVTVRGVDGTCRGCLDWGVVPI